MSNSYRKYCFGIFSKKFRALIPFQDRIHVPNFKHITDRGRADRVCEYLNLLTALECEVREFKLPQVRKPRRKQDPNQLLLFPIDPDPEDTST